MRIQKTHLYQTVGQFILFMLLLLLLYFLIKPVISIILGAILLAYVSYPLYSKLLQKTNAKILSIILALLIVVIIIIIPILFLTFEITGQTVIFYNSLSDNIAKGALFGFGCTSAESQVCSLLNQAEAFSIAELQKYGFDKQLISLLPAIEQEVTNIILGIPLIIASIFLSIIMAFFILKDWRKMLENIIRLLPMRSKTVKRLKREFQNITYTVVYAQIFVAIIQGILGTIGFYFAGVPFPLIFGILLAFCALIPTIGTAIIWFPASLFLILSGFFSQDYWTLARGIVLFFYGLLVISTIDNILLATIVHAKAEVSQLSIIIGVIGGASLFGFIGIFVGPILLPLLLTYFETFRERFL